MKFVGYDKRRSCIDRRFLPVIVIIIMGSPEEEVLLSLGTALPFATSLKSFLGCLMRSFSRIKTERVLASTNKSNTLFVLCNCCKCSSLFLFFSFRIYQYVVLVLCHLAMIRIDFLTIGLMEDIRGLSFWHSKVHEQ